MNKDNIRISKFLSLVLRHEPERIGIELDESGWADVNEVLKGCQRSGMALSLDRLREVVATNDKKRFAFSEDGTRIRASQGHSVEVELGYQPQVPPEFLFHGTVAKFLDSIREKGLLKGERHHVHLSHDETTALKVGERRGKPILLKIRAAEMQQHGAQFFLSTNGVWLVDAVPPEFIVFP